MFSYVGCIGCFLPGVVTNIYMH